MTEPSYTEPFATYSPSGLPGFALRKAQANHWRKGALIWRKIARKTFPYPVMDAIVEGLKLRLHLNDNVSERKFLFMPRFFDVKERQLIAERLPKDGVFLDVGANAGIYSLLAAKHLSHQGRVIAIEPNPVLHARFTQNIAFNGFGEIITLLNYGVSDREGSFPLVLDPTNLGGSSLAKTEGSFIEVPCKPLATILKERGITRVDVMKIDIEGAEDRALIPFFATAPRTLFPHLVIIENSDDRWQEDLPLAFEKAGYTPLFKSRMNTVWQLQ